MRFGSLALALVSLTACMPSASVETSPVVTAEPGSTPAPPERRYARLSGDVTLYADPSTTALRVVWTGETRIVELVDERDGFSQIRTLLPREVAALGFDAGEGLDVLTLVAWVEQQRTVEVEPGSASRPGAAPSTEAEPPRAAAPKFMVHAGSALRWPDGRVAGEAVADHSFFTPAIDRDAEGADGVLALGCHQSRTLPTGGSISGWLCTADEPDAGTAMDPTKAVALDRPPASSLASGDTAVQGSMDRDIIRRIVRAHINEVRTCYNNALAVDPQLSGRVVINFVIGGDGSVTSATVQDDSLSDPEVGRCTAKAVQTWTFPKPLGGGNVTVTYPFNFSPG